MSDNTRCVKRRETIEGREEATQNYKYSWGTKELTMIQLLKLRHDVEAGGSDSFSPDFILSHIIVIIGTHILHRYYMREVHMRMMLIIMEKK